MKNPPEIFVQSASEIFAALVGKLYPDAQRLLAVFAGLKDPAHAQHPIVPIGNPAPDAQPD